MLPSKLIPGIRVLSGEPDASLLALGHKELDRALPDGGLRQGSVVEFSVLGPSGVATSLSLLACRAAQEGAQSVAGKRVWCAFVDPSCSLHGPGVKGSGVDLERLLVVRPPKAQLPQVSVRLAETKAFAVIVIDLLGVVGDSLEGNLGNWARHVRRLAVMAKDTSSIICLLTDAKAKRSLPLPVAMRVSLQRVTFEHLKLQVVKEQRGRISAPQTLLWPLRGKGLTSRCEQAGLRQSG